ncbi:MAG: TonB-dependent receptor [Proteobacteria bacterium]|nr:TonB-dependent receptor [Pseudomonadota bacterium]HQR04551.1 TonB-dependent receptor [Rhodocyclaceae bacterium]
MGLRIISRPTILAVSIAALAQAGTAFADDPFAIEEVVVTAQKRAEKLQDVPIAISAISGAQLDDRGIQSIADLSSLAPNLQIHNAPGNSTAAQVAMRGSVTNNPALIWDAAVGLYLDGVYLGKSQGNVFDAIDLERVEVLRGPQGTLYGRNTTAGAINLITRKPSGEWGGSVNVDLGNYGAQVIKASFDLPKIGIMSLNFGLRDEKRDGWVKTTAGSSVNELNNRNNQEYRLAANFKFSEQFQIDYKYDKTNVDQKSTYNQLWRANPAFYGPMGLGGLMNYVSQSRQTTASVNGPTFEKMNVEGNALTFTYQVNDHNTLKWIAAHRTMTWDDGLDLDGSPLSIAHTQRYSNYKQDSHELQWVGTQGNLNYVLGYYYFKDNGRTLNPQTYFSQLGAGGLQFDSRYAFTTEVNAWFTQLDYKLTDKWTLTGGLRGTQEKKTVDRYLQLTNFGFALPAFIPFGTTAAKTFNSTTPMVSLGYKYSENVNLYGKYSEGYKSGGFNGEAQVVSDVITPYKPEKVKEWELGAKTTFADGKAQLNVAYFNKKVSDMQVPVFQGTGAAGSIVTNVGKATIQGLEIEGTFVPTDGLRFNVGYGYLDTKYDRFMDYATAADQLAGILSDQKDNRAFIHAPKHTLNLVADARLARTQWGVLRGIADYSYTSSQYMYPYQLTTTNPGQANANDTKVGAMDLWNFKLLLSDIPLGRKGDKAEASLWVRNAFDKKMPGNFIDFGPGFGSLTQAYFITPRTYGISASYKW